MVFPPYRNVQSTEVWVNTVLGVPLISLGPAQGEYLGCRPVGDCLNQPTRPSYQPISLLWGNSFGPR
ncbi:uncharacterized protein METZ01_LOCUS23324 [marine metagenome]|uniref:Uncharacterized protein n=1 Tax=marine metagenome TaxID=408172 RepID=A0A381PU93_9ZZZZ